MRLKELKSLCGSVLFDEPMSRHTTFRIGGKAAALADAASEDEIRNVVIFCRGEGIPLFVCGNGSNLLVSDAGFDGVILRIENGLSEVSVEGKCVRAQAGAMLSKAALAALSARLAGLEFASGIPGTVGGGCVMNAGAYGGELKDVLREIRIMLPDGTVRSETPESLNLGYRTSDIPALSACVLSAEFSLNEGDQEAIKSRMDELRQRRREKQPLNLPSAGSTFKRPEGNFAGKLIEEAGLKGFRVGGAEVSEKHCGFVVNTGGASAADVAELIAQVKKRVFENSGVELVPEVRFVGF